MRLLKRLLAIELLVLLVPAFALGAPGELDLTFNGTGISRIGFDEGDDRAFAAAIQTDGKIVVAGRAFNGQDYDFALARYNPDGSLDATFNFDGLVNTAIFLDDEATSVVIQPDGKIVVAGYAHDGSVMRIAVVRYETDGSLDPTFDADGIATAAVGASTTAFGVLVDANGNILVAGDATIAGNLDLAVLRFNPDGSLDTTFDADGIVTTPVSAGNDTARSIAIQPDGLILVAGSSASGPDGSGPSDFVLARYDTSGNLDTAFDGDGILVTSIGASSDVAMAVVVDSFGVPARIVAAGYAFNPLGSGTGFDIAVARYNLDGSLDVSFDSDGIVTTSITNDADFAYSAHVQPTDGKILVAGSSRSGSRRFAAVRYNDDGSLDPNFDADGIVTAPIQSGDAQARAVAVKSGGEVVLAGHSSKSSEQDLTDDFSIVQLTPSGTFDLSFDSDGTAVTPWHFTTSTAYAIAIQPDGKLVVAGYVDNGAGIRDIALVRFNVNGTLDTTFNGTGKVRSDFGFNEAALAVEIQADGKIVVAGETGQDFIVVRYNSNGSLDTTFNGVGFVVTSVGLATDFATAVKIQTDGKIVVGGSTLDVSYKFAVVRYNPDGSLDTSFDGDGKVVTPIGTSADFVSSLAIQTDGKIIAAGSSFTNFTNYDDFAVVRYNPDGSLDTSFDADGKVTTNIPGTFGSSTDTARAIAVQTDGKIVVVGETSGDLLKKFAVVRYNTDGTLDSAFGSGGLVKTAVGIGESGAFTVAIQTDGKLFVGGYASLSLTSKAFAIVRYNPNGTLAPFAENAADVWGSGGVVLLDLSGGDDFVLGLRLDSQNRVVIAGEANGQFGVVRLEGELVPTSATVSISGRVMAANGAGLRNAIVSLTDAAGVTKTTRTGSFGYYRFDGINAGQSVVITVVSKHYQFEPRIVAVDESVSNVDFLPVGPEADRK